MMGRAVMSSPLAVGGRSARALLGRLSVAVLWVYLLAVTCGAQSADSVPVSSPIMGSSSPPGPGFASLGGMVEKPNGVRDGSEFYCFRGFKRCTSGIKQCIKPEQECDGVKDCEDGSDEGQFCKSFDCTERNQYMCPSGKMCMNVTHPWGEWRYIHRDPYTAYLCDGVKDCADGSDEDETFCGSYDCNSNVPHKEMAMTLEWAPPTGRRLRCPGGKGGCVNESQLCDGTVNCVTDAGSDESEELCKKRGCSAVALTNLFQCRTGRCIQRQRMCDGKKDCPDGDDEGEFCARLNCPNYGIKCNDTQNRTCIQESQVCDGVLDCPGGTDEADCNTIECQNAQRECPSGEECAYFTPCDGVKDCKDGSDEDPAFCSQFNCSGDGSDSPGMKCKDGLQCVSRRRFCDGHQDCRDLSDEDPAFCRTYNCSEGEQGKINCPGGGYVWCVSGSYLCDGYGNECYLDNDEDPTFCASKEARDILEAFSKIDCSYNKTNYIDGDYCDGIRNCADGSDESDSFCEAYKCPKNRVKCYDKWCVPGGKCDGNWDCPDGSDEQNC
eukprot:TRINITY_DN568_c0_g1_i2.p1 TRINITY_DN568_c0_g1~~TRINITY_DN568_c0_g1_i2.p1  ORF type:complete len:552 (+),score=68.89 TRINITY_DN568_c0_g1_i2:219-1874(+)